MHHQGVKRIGSGLEPCARAADGLVEALESPNGQFLIGVQWHPEVFEATNPHTRGLFRGFVEAARAWQEEGKRAVPA
jgi:putative glutamine amidotransferase